MGKVFGHILPGVIMSGFGLWHLINHIRLFFSRGPASYVAPAWFPAPRIRYLELILILAFSVYGIVGGMLWVESLNPPPSPSVDDFIRFHHNVHEHNLFFAMAVIYAASGIYLDYAQVRGRQTLCTLLVAALAAQELFVFYFHSADHSGVEGQLHLLLQIIITLGLAAALLSAAFPQIFVVSLVRSASIALQGVWFIVIGVNWIPSLVAEGCSIDLDADGFNKMYRCHSEASEHHAKAVVNLQFGWCVVFITVFIVGLYSYLYKTYQAAAVEAAAYGRLPPPEAADESDDIKVPYNSKAVHIIGGDEHHREFTPTQIEV